MAPRKPDQINKDIASGLNIDHSVDSDFSLLSPNDENAVEEIPDTVNACSDFNASKSSNTISGELSESFDVDDIDVSSMSYNDCIDDDDEVVDAYDGMMSTRMQRCDANIDREEFSENEFDEN